MGKKATLLEPIRKRRDQGGLIRCSSCFIALKHRPWKEIDATGVLIGDCTFAQIVCCCPGLMDLGSCSLVLREPTEQGHVHNCPLGVSGLAAALLSSALPSPQLPITLDSRKQTPTNSPGASCASPPSSLPLHHCPTHTGPLLTAPATCQAWSCPRAFAQAVHAAWTTVLDFHMA